MRILTVHNKYKFRGGEDVLREAEDALLRSRGHFVDSYIKDSAEINGFGVFRAGLKAVWSKEAYADVRRRVREEKIDVLYCHNLLPLISPSVYYAARRERAAVVQMIGNYRLLCTNGFLFRDGKICEECVGKIVPYPSVKHACYRNSTLGSGVVASMQSLHRTLDTYRDQVDLYIAVSDFVKMKIVESGLLPADKIAVKPNFVGRDYGAGDGAGNFALFVGRLSAEKGLKTLLAAWEKLPTARLKIVGEGPLETEVRRAAEANPNVEWLGAKTSAEVAELMGAAAFLVFPSEWYEAFGLVCIEAFARGTPVVGARIGAIAGLVEHERTGLHFEPMNANDLAAKIEWLLANPAHLKSMRREARAEYEAKYTAEANYPILMDIYRRAVSQARSRN